MIKAPAWKTPSVHTHQGVHGDDDVEEEDDDDGCRRYSTHIALEPARAVERVGRRGGGAGGWPAVVLFAIPLVRRLALVLLYHFWCPGPTFLSLRPANEMVPGWAHDRHVEPRLVSDVYVLALWTSLGMVTIY